MAGKTENCAEIRERMFDAATDSLSDDARGAFGAHIGECAACAKEFQRMRTLTQAIDRSLSANLSVEPPPQFISNVRRQIIAQPHRVTWWRQRSAWLTVAGVCVALAISVLTVRSAREFNRPTNNRTVASINVPATPKPTVHSQVNAMEAATAAQPRKPALAVVSHALRTAHHKASEPEIIVEPGQMQAILRFAAAMRSGQIDGAKLLADQEKAGELPKIKPLAIAPLKIVALSDETAPGSGSAESGDRDFVTGHEN